MFRILNYNRNIRGYSQEMKNPFFSIFKNSVSNFVKKVFSHTSSIEFFQTLPVNLINSSSEQR